MEQTPRRTGLTLVLRQAGLGDEAFVLRKDFGSSVFVVETRELLAIEERELTAADAIGSVRRV